MKAHYFDVEDLAAKILGFGDSYESGQIEQGLYDKFEISTEQFHKVVEALLPYTIPAKTALTGSVCHGFVDDGCFIVKGE